MRKFYLVPLGRSKFGRRNAIIGLVVVVVIFLFFTFFFCVFVRYFCPNKMVMNEKEWIITGASTKTSSTVEKEIAIKLKEKKKTYVFRTRRRCIRRRIDNGR